MAQVLYRKYRSTKLEDLVGQDHIADTLCKALKKGAISHAYLLTGPRGVGKTSVARILAHEVNGIDYSLDDFHLDIIEIDAASNRRIDEIRELRDKINLAPTQLKYKVYIIDEVHMLTREAFNALLKTLEEPPEHVIFILATTELNKVPETIVSRCQRFSFKHVDEETQAKHLAKIAKLENIRIDEGSIRIIAEHSRGSFRDALSLLDQLGSMSSHVTEKDTRNVIGLSPDSKIKLLLSNLEAGDFTTTLDDYRGLMGDGADPVILASQLAQKIRATLGSHNNKTKMITLLEDLLDVAKSRDPEASLEITLLKNIPSSTSQPSPNPEAPETTKDPVDNNAPEAPEHIKPAATSQKKNTKEFSESIDTKKPPKEKKTAAIDAKPKKTKNKESGLPLSDDDWQRALTYVKEKKNTLYTILRMANHGTDDGKIVLSFQFPFHVKRANDKENKACILEALDDIGITHSGLEIVVADKAASEAPSQPEQASEPSSTPSTTDKPQNIEPGKPVPSEILDVFSGAEVMES